MQTDTEHADRAAGTDEGHRHGRVRAGVVLALAAALGAAGVVSAPAVAAPATHSRHTVVQLLNGNFPDPGVVVSGKTYYAYSTASQHGHIPVATGTVLRRGSFTPRGDALPKLPPWVKPTGSQVWAPDVSKRPDGRYLMYYAAISNTPSGGAYRHCIGAALATGPAGPFTPAGDHPVVCRDDLGGSIDASAFTDGGRHYLLYKSAGNPVHQRSMIWIQQVADDGITPRGPAKMILRADHPGGTVEAPYLVKHGTRFVLFYSTGTYSTDTYAERWASSTSLDHGYTPASAPLLASATDTKPHCTPGNAGTLSGPGGGTVVHTTAGDEILYHGIVACRPHLSRALYASPLGWTHSDTPYLR